MSTSTPGTFFTHNDIETTEKVQLAFPGRLKLSILERRPLLTSHLITLGGPFVFCGAQRLLVSLAM